MDNNNKKIIKNTVYLYIRTFVIMIISFLTTRIVLDKLGSSDYGLNNLIGGFVSMFTVLNSILNTGTNRFLSLYLGKGDTRRLKDTFSTAFVIHLIVGIIVVLLLETLGIWFLNFKLNIDPHRMHAANIVFQCSVIATFFSITQIPYTAAVTSHEKFSIYAMMSIFDVTAKLLTLYLLVTIPGDKLVIYAILQLCVSICNISIYRIYCIKHFAECSWSLHVDKTLFKEMASFSGWSTLGHVLITINAQGTSIILNIFFNTVMNAARGLAQTVMFTIGQFIQGFLVAAQPQLIKYYGNGDMKRFIQLIFNVSQYTLFLVAIFMVPVLMEIDYVVKLWLGNEVPQYTIAFIKITMICTVIYNSNHMVDCGITAIGRVKELNSWSIPIYLLSLPLCYIVLYLGMGPIVMYWIASVPPLLAFLVNLKILSKYTDFPALKYFYTIFMKNIFLIAVSCIIPFMIRSLMTEGIIRFFIVCSVSVLCTFITIYFVGMNQETRELIKQKIFHRFINKRV